MGAEGHHKWPVPLRDNLLHVCVHAKKRVFVIIILVWYAAATAAAGVLANLARIFWQKALILGVKTVGFKRFIDAKVPGLKAVGFKRFIGEKSQLSGAKKGG